MGNDGSSAGAGAPTHTGGDEHHLGAVVEHFADLIDALFSGLSGAFGTIAGAETFVSQLQAVGYGRVGQCFGVGVADHKVDIVHAGAVHVVDGVATTATHTNHLDDFGGCGGNVDIYGMAAGRLGRCRGTRGSGRSFRNFDVEDEGFILFRRKGVGHNGEMNGERKWNSTKEGGEIFSPLFNPLR